MKRFYILAITMLAVAGTIGPGRALGMGQRPHPLTMVVAPANHAVLQVLFDVAEFRPLILVSYQAGPHRTHPLLHAWNGAEWVYVSPQDYADAEFLKRLPAQTVLVGGDEFPPGLKESSSWVPKVWQVPTIHPAELINALDRILDFTKAEWSYLAGRFDLDLQDVNADQRKDSWYYHPYVEPEVPPRQQADPMEEPEQDTWSAGEDPGADADPGDAPPPEPLEEIPPPAGAAP